VQYGYVQNDSSPGENQYSIWWNDDADAWTVTWNNASDSSLHDIIVHGDSPTVEDIVVF
jgi:hypothetical protein